jgi:serine/threonine-protein kinase
MSPEQHRGEAGDRRVDVYALGVVLYELLADRKPYVGDTLAAIRAAVLAGEAPPADRIDAGVPQDLAAIAARAMAVDPEQRFRSARALSRALRGWLEAHPEDGDGATGSPSPDAAGDDSGPTPLPSPPVASSAPPVRSDRPTPSAPAGAPASLRRPRLRTPGLLVAGTLAAMAIAACLGVAVAQRARADATLPQQRTSATGAVAAAGPVVVQRVAFAGRRPVPRHHPGA